MWAIQDQDTETVSMYGQGQYELLTGDQSLAAVENDGNPRYIVCHEDTLEAVSLEDGGYEASSGLKLFLALDPSCFLYYMNACDANDSAENVRRTAKFSTKKPDKESAPGFLADSENGVAFSLTRPIKKGEQLLHFFPSRESIKRVRLSNAGVGGEGGAAASPGGRMTRASARGTMA